MKIYFILLAFFMLAVSPQHAFSQTPQWHYLGDTTISAEYSNGALMAIFEGIPYIAFGGNCGASLATIVKKYDGAQWNLIDTAGLGEMHYQSLGISADGKPQLAYYENKKIGIKRLENSTWNTITESPEMSGSISNFSCAFDDKKLFVAFSNFDFDNKVSVWGFDGSEWFQVGQPFISTADAASTILKISDGILWLAYLEPKSSKSCFVKKFNGTDWEIVGGQVFTGTFTHMHNPFIYHVPHFDFAVSAGEPFIAYTDSTSHYRVNVLKFDGTAWTSVGQPMFTEEDVSTLRIAIDTIDSTPYILFNDHTLDLYGASVMHFDGNTWDYVGNRIFTSDFWSVHFEIDHGIPYFAYEPPLFCPKVSVQVFSPLTPVVEPKITEISFKINPNPLFGEVLQIQIQSTKESIVIAQASDMEGRLVYESEINLVPGVLDHQLNMGTLNTGVYIIRLRSRDGREFDVKRFVVVR